MNDIVRVSDIISVLDEAFPLKSQDDWDNSGLIIGSPEMQVKGVLFSVDITQQCVDEAIENGLNMIVAHHPMLFRGAKRITGSSSEQRIIMSAIKNDIAICAFHTPADKALCGLSSMLAKQIGIEKTDCLVPECESQGYGVVGNLPEKMPVDGFLQMLREKIGCKVVRYNDFSRAIRRVAICTGSGSEFISNAISAKADAYVTADVKYHQFQQPDGRMLIADIGHYESEDLSKKLFFEVVSEKFPKFALRISNASSNAIKYCL